MRTTTLTSTIVLCALALAGCAAEPEAQDPPSPTAAASTPASSPTPTASVATDVAPDVVLAESDWSAVGLAAPRDESTGVVDWRLPDACAAGAPAPTSAMRTVTQGTGELESAVGVQQVVVLPDADAAVAEAERLTATLTACTAGEPPTLYVAEPVPVGAQGIGLATDYYGSSASGPLDDAMGTYVAVTRRGTAVMLVGLDGGESTVGSARTTVSGLAQQGWELLCPFDSAGC